MTAEAKDAIATQARALGFDAVGFTEAAADPLDQAHLTAFLADGRHGTMDWMVQTADRRTDPQRLWPPARSVVCLGLNYGPAENPLAVLSDPAVGAISVYARGRDYHRVMKKKLKELARWIVRHWGGAVKVFVDTAPVMEKPLAARAGLGWIGKHSNLVSRRFGSWLVLGEVFTTLELPPDAPHADRCGSCERCLKACPTDALPEPYRIEPRRCLSYLTVEHRGDLPPNMAAAARNRIFGCDDCLAVCPWNRFATGTPHGDLAARPALNRPLLTDLAAIDDPQFRTLFAGTTIKRLGSARFHRNVQVAIANATRQTP